MQLNNSNKEKENKEKYLVDGTYILKKKIS